MKEIIAFLILALSLIALGILISMYSNIAAWVYIVLLGFGILFFIKKIDATNDEN